MRKTEGNEWRVWKDGKERGKEKLKEWKARDKGKAFVREIDKREREAGVKEGKFEGRRCFVKWKKKGKKKLEKESL